MVYAPNQEKDVVLGCGCLETWAFAVRVLGSGEGKWWQDCPNGHVGPGKWGMQPIKREATGSEVLRFYGEGIPATVRRTRGASKKVRTVPGQSNGQTGTERPTASHDADATLW